MSDILRIALVGATGLVGRAIIGQGVGRANIRLMAIARRQVELPIGAMMDMVVGDSAEWGAIIAQLRPQVVIIALGTTWRKAGRDEAVFRAVDFDLVTHTARAAQASGASRCVAISSVNADPSSRMLYPRVKGEAEAALQGIGFARLDIIRPGLLRGRRDNDPRMAERIGQIVSPVADMAMHGRFRSMRSVSADTVAQAALALAMRKAKGRFKHEYDGILRAASQLPRLSQVVDTSKGGAL